MPDTTLWKDKCKRQEFIDAARAIAEGACSELSDREDAVILAIEPHSGDVFFGRTLGAANRTAAAKYLDKWIFYVRRDDLNAGMPLPAW
jgi:hypothetical protein